jgi:hypothetical protein
MAMRVVISMILLLGFLTILGVALITVIIDLVNTSFHNPPEITPQPQRKNLGEEQDSDLLESSSFALPDK